MFKKLKNRYLVWKFPYLKPRKYDGTEIPDYNYNSTDLDCYPDGWRKVLIKYFKQLNKILIEYGELDNFYVTDAKEKWGSARLYYGGVTNEECHNKIDRLLMDMEKETGKTCNWCGKPAEYESTGYILPFCSKCCHTPKCLLHFKKIEVQEEDT